MIARLLISPSLEQRKGEINRILKDAHFSKSHPDLLYLPHDSKLGIEQARKIKEHFSLKPYSALGRVVVLEDASALTPEAQNALLKILEEPPHHALIILGASSDAKFLPTILSRCQIVRVQGIEDRIQGYEKDIEKLISASIEERFEYIEKLKDREEFLHALIQLRSDPRSRTLRKLLQAEQWASQNVNIRAILEYLMLVMPQNL